jgi:DinB superfamily
MSLNIENLKFPIGEFQKPISISENDLKTWISVIENFPNHIKLLTENLSVEELNLNYRPEGWSIKQVVHHCADSHMNALIRTKLALTEILPAIKPYQEAVWANLIDGNTDSISDSMMIINGVHAKWTLLLKNMDAADLEKEYYHPENNRNYKLNEVIGLYAWHCDHHFAHITQALRYNGKFDN